MNTCMTLVTVQAHGGGSRWYCPTCDTQQRAFGPPVVYWTNSTPPANRLCPNVKSKSKIEKLVSNGIKLDIW